MVQQLQQQHDVALQQQTQQHEVQLETMMYEILRTYEGASETSDKCSEALRKFRASLKAHAPPAELVICAQCVEDAFRAGG